ncbi:MAG: methylamine utilization protein MauE [Gammaproteobacteria bacterium]|nr:methylamine utilization protein MauE [Gammaproteobacteria bacterium]
MIDPVLQQVLGMALALLFLHAAWHKWTAGLRFEAQLAEYRMLPEAAVPGAARTLMVLEALVAMGLLLPVLRQPAAILAALLLGAYALAMAVNLARGRHHIDCGCGDTPQLLSGWLVGRNLVLVAGSVLLARPAAPRAPATLDMVLGLLGLCALVLTWLMLEQLLANASVLREWRESRD